jgi:hypothetical protein
VFQRNIQPSEHKPCENLAETLKVYIYIYIYIYTHIHTRTYFIFTMQRKSILNMPIMRLLFRTKIFLRCEDTAVTVTVHFLAMAT